MSEYVQPCSMSTCLKNDSLCLALCRNRSGEPERMRRVNSRKASSRSSAEEAPLIFGFTLQQVTLAVLALILLLQASKPPLHPMGLPVSLLS